MIQAALMGITAADNQWKYSASLKVDGKHYSFFIDNPEDIPHDMRSQMDTGDRLAGVFTFEPEDQFARYIDQETLQASWDRLL
jgi:hypothetical protein